MGIGGAPDCALVGSQATDSGPAGECRCRGERPVSVFCEKYHELEIPVFVGPDFQLEVDFWPVFGRFWPIPGPLKSGFWGFIHFRTK